MIRKFVDRREELKFLEENFQKEGPQLIILYGRRRVGKTELVLNFVQKKPSIYFLAIEAGEKENLDLFFDALHEYFKDDLILSLEKSWESAFRYLSKINQRIVLIIDEFPYLIEADKSTPSIFQRGWDLYLSKTNLMLILLGSSIGMMETEVLGYKSPLYGRRTGQWKLEPLKYKNLTRFFPNYPKEDLIRVYGTLDSIPAYLIQFDPKKDFWTNVREKVLRKGEFLYQEVEFLLKEELRKPKTYMSILKAIAIGNSKLSRIMNETGISKSKLSSYLKNLEELGFIEKLVPVTEGPRSKKGRYFLEDNFFKFWFNFVFPNLRDLERRRIGIVLSKVKKEFNTYLGKVFERVAKEFLTEKVGPVGPWWYRDKEIDLVNLNAKKKAASFFEVKWSKLKKREAIDLLRELKLKSKHIRWYKERKENFGLVAREIEKKEDLREKGYEIYDLEDLFKN